MKERDEMRIFSVFMLLCLLGTAFGGVVPLPHMVGVAAGTYSAPEGSELDRWIPKGFKSVTVKTFQIARDPVTVRQFMEYLSAVQPPQNNKLLLLNDNPDAPARVNWYQAQQYAAWYSRRVHQKYRLPTRAEWAAAVIVFAPSLGAEVDCPFSNPAMCQTLEPTPLNELGEGPIRQLWGNTLEWGADGEEGCHYVHGQRHFQQPRGTGIASFSCYPSTLLSPLIGFRLVKDE